MKSDGKRRGLVLRFAIEHPLFAFAFGVLLALSLVIAIAGPMLDAPPNDVLLLMLFLSSTGGLSVLTSFALYKFGLAHWFSSLRWALLAMVVLTVVLIFVNVWITAQLMFIKQHDLILTALLLVFAGLSAISFGFFISSALTERISNLTNGAERLASGDLSTRVEVIGKDELTSLAATFNRMATRLEEADAQKRLLEQTRRDLIAWVSHDLRTPLASIRVMVEAMADGVVSDPDTVQRYLHNAQGEIQHLSRLIDDLFELAQLDAGRVELHMEPSSLRDLISDTLESMRAQAERRNITLSGQVDDKVDIVVMASEKIQRVLDNLIGNALRHTPPGGKVMLQAQLAGDSVRVEIADSGEGIAPEDIPHVFESFFRGEKSRARDDQGVRGAGLGLAIAKGLVEAHGGHIWVNSQPNRGATFAFTLPYFSHQRSVYP
ncbi:MAG: ATP-binding protein [Chloroflexota bacterium]